MGLADITCTLTNFATDSNKVYFELLRAVCGELL